jgi:hypothetical protein
MWNMRWYRGVALTGALAVTLSAAAQQTQNQQQAQKQKATTHSASPAPFNPCTGDGLPPSSQMAPFAPGSPSNINPPMPKTLKGGVTCSNGKCRSTKENQYEQEMNSDSGPELPLSPGATRAGKKNEAKERNAFPLEKSEAAQKKADETNAPEASAGQANPFPEAQSQAAQAARQKAADQPPAQPGDYSSSNQRLPDVNALGNGPVVNDGGETVPAFDPALAKRDDKVGKYYLQTGDWAGAYGRYRQATRVDQEDLKAVIGLAMAADHLGKREVAMRNYKLYLDVAPNGKHSKDARKALKRLSKEK